MFSFPSDSSWLILLKPFWCNTTFILYSGFKMQIQCMWDFSYWSWNHSITAFISLYLHHFTSILPSPQQAAVWQKYKDEKWKMTLMFNHSLWLRRGEILDCACYETSFHFILVFWERIKMSSEQSVRRRCRIADT